MRLERNSAFPMTHSVQGAYKYRCIVGIGGNVGDVKKRFKSCYALLRHDRRMGVLKTSAVFKNPPFGYKDQEDFYNAAMLLATSLHVNAFMRLLLHVERRFRRKRVFKNGPRTLDLDIIFFHNLRRRQKHVTLPHPCWEERLSVCVPLVWLQRTHKG